MIGLQDEFEKLPVPNVANEYSYSAVAIKGYENHRIGKDYKDNPCLLISTESTSEKFKISRQKLYNLSITHNLNCEVEINGKRENHTFSVVRYLGHDEMLKSYFLKVCEMLINSLGNTPSKKQITNTTNKFIELFKALIEPPRKTVQGIWAELFLIHQSKCPEKLVSAWHSIPEEKYDFSSKKVRIEVKSSSMRNRTHHFSHEQLVPPTQCDLYIASVYVEMLSGGKSLEDLLNDILVRLQDNQDLKEKLNLITYSTLGESVDKISNIYYDYELAKDSLRFYNSKDIPKIGSIPNNIFEIKYKCQLDYLNHSNIMLEELI